MTTKQSKSPVSRPPEPYLKKSAQGAITDAINKAIREDEMRSELEQSEKEKSTEDAEMEQAERIARERQMEIISQYPELVRFGEYLIAELKRGKKAPSIIEAAIVLKIDAVRLRNLIYKYARRDWRAVRAELERELVMT
jgi:hypothetical protein